MRVEGKVSKVAICERCESYVIARHIDRMDNYASRQFNHAIKDGFTIKLETMPETQARTMGIWKNCMSLRCEEMPKNKRTDNGFEFEKGIPIPKHIKEFKYPLDKMEVGDSFLVQNKLPRQICNVIHAFMKNKQPDWKFTTRKIENDVRVWRIK